MITINDKIESRMIRKVLYYLIACFMVFSIEELKAQFTFTYTGPDTIYLNNNCTAILEWGHPATPTVTSTVGNTITSFEIFSISGGYTMGGTVSQQVNVTVTYKAIDNQLNSAFFSFNIAFVDTIKPQITTLPTDKSITCETPESVIISELSLWYNNHAGMLATDNCGSVSYTTDKTFSETETAFNQSINDNCGNTRTVTVIFSAIDQYGNNSANSYAATFFTFDNKKPTVVKEPSPINIPCNELTDNIFESWIDDKGGARVIDNCTDSAAIKWFFVWNDNIGGSGYEEVGDKPYSLKNKKNCNYSGNINFIAKDECGNQQAAFFTTFKITDESIPVFSSLPQDVIIDCSAVVPRPVVTAYDACKGNIAVIFSETSTKVNHPDSCKYYNYSLVQTWKSNDECGHLISHSRKIIVIDTLVLVYTLSLDMFVGCTEYQNLDITGRPAGVSDNCDSKPLISFQDVKSGDGCEYHIFRTWKITDVCGNKNEKIQDLTIVDTIFPVVVKAPTDLFIKCDSSVSFIESFNNWISKKGFAEISDNCNKVFSFAAKPGSYIPGNPGTYPGKPVSFDMPDTLACSADSLLYFKDVDFVFYDRCFNTLHFTARFAISDLLKPKVTACPKDTIMVMETGFCEKSIVLPMPEVTDNCSGENIEIVKSVSSPIKSTVQGNYEIPVNPVKIDIGPFSNLEKIPSEILNLSLEFENIDADDPNEFFYIVNENNDTIATTPIIEDQCGDFIIQLKDLFTITELASFLSDGYLTLRLLPNIPASGGIFAINDVCQTSFVVTKLNYTRENPNKLEYYLKINNGDYNFVGNGLPVDTILPAGTHNLTYKMLDCGQNEVTCSNTIIIQDKEKPNITCPSDISIFLPDDTCSVKVPLPLSLIFSDNCSENFNNLIRVPSDTSKSFLTYNYNPEIEEYTANSKVFIFDNLNSDLLLLNPKLQIRLTGDIEDPDEYFEIINENGQIIGNTSNSNIYTTPGDCTKPSYTNIDININDFSNWAKDGIITFIARPANTPDKINPCNTISNNGESDNISKMIMFLEFKKVDINFSSNGAQVFNTIPLNHQNRNDFSFRSGISDIRYVINDGSENRDTCSFHIEVIDKEPPVAKCKNFYVLFVNPSGTENSILNPEEINENSSDNCGVNRLTVSPSSFDCTVDNTNQLIKLQVWDEAGNSDSCTTSILVKVSPLQPSYSSGVCVHDSLKLFANLPPAPDNIWTIEWSGPDGFTSNLMNPVRPNADASFSGTYVLTVTGFNGCRSSGTVEVVVEDLSRPVILAKKSRICIGENLILESNSYSGNVKYHWFSGSYPVGTFIDSTLSPIISLKPAIGNNFFYVIARSEKCQSLASFSTQVEVVPQPVAIIQNPFISLCEGEVFAPKGSANGSSYTFRWWGPDGFSSSAQIPTAINNITPVQQGTYYLEVSNSVCSDTASLELVVFDKPETPVIESNSVYCKNKPIILRINNVQNADNYIWLLNDKLYVNQFSNSLIIPEAKPQYEGNWTAIVKNGNCYSDTSAVVNIKIEEEYNIIAGSNSPVCEGDSIRLFSPLVSNAVYKWTGPDGFISSQQNPVLNSDKSGEYLLTVTTQAGCNYFSSSFVDIKTRPKITALSSNAPECLTGKDCVRLVPTVYPFNTPFAYSWNGPESFSSASAMPEICDFSEKNNGEYSLIVYDGNCSSDSVFLTIASKIKPAVPLLEGDGKVCEGDTIKITIKNDSYSEGTKFNWTVSPGGSAVTTINPYFIIPVSSEINSGAYTVSAEKDGCLSEISDDFNLTVIRTPNQPFITGTARICEGETIELKTSNVPGGKFYWTGPGNFTSTDQNPKIFPAGISNGGVYTLRVSVESCFSEISEGFVVQVVKTPLTPEIIPVDSSFCIGKNNSKISVCLNKTEANTNYSWYQNTLPAKLILSSPDECIEITDFSQFKDGVNSIFVIASKDGCRSPYSQVESFIVNKVPDRIADAGDDVYACYPDNISIRALPDPEGSWRSLSSSAFVNNPNKSTAQVFDLEYGINYFVWSLTHGVCKEFSSDTAAVFLEYIPEALDDEFFTPYNTPVTIDILKNDIETEDTEITVIPDNNIKGTIEINPDGTLTFTPEAGFIGEVSFSYEIRKKKCRANYSLANIKIEIGDENDCFGVNVITPNGDGINDKLIFPCLESGKYLKNEIFIFNQWGDQVYQAYNYKNDWQGTYKSKDLPVGTYFYILFLDTERKNALKGFFVIER